MRWLALAACLTAYVALSLWLDFGLIDDAYISLRYADHLAGGLGLVFNPGERVEGYTNPLWTVLLAGGIALGLDGPALAFGLGLASGCAAVALAFVFAARQSAGFDTLRGAAAALCLASSAPFLCYGVSGMETPLYGFLLLASAILLVEGLANERRLAGSALALAAASLARPEAIALLPFNLAWLAARKLRARGPRASRIALYVGLYAALVGAFLLWRRAYYGDWLPNTYYAKVGEPSGELLRAGLGYVGRYALQSYLVAVLPLIALWRSLRTRTAAPYLAGLLVVHLAAIALEGGDHLALLRFCAPLAPIAAILYAEVGFAAAAEMARRRWIPARAAAAAAAMAVVATGISSSALMASRRVMHGMSEWERAHFEVALAEEWAEFGRWLRTEGEPGDSVALLPIGAIGYYSGFRVVDMLGLTDPHTALLERRTGAGYIGHEKWDAVWVLRQRPRFILANHRVRFARPLDEGAYTARPYFPVHRELVERPELARDYEYRSAQAAPGVFFCFYERRR